MGDKIPKDTAYVYWSCLEDDKSCLQCRELEYTHWLPGANVKLPPLNGCASKDRMGCRCMGVYVSNQEVHAKNTAKFIRSQGGIVSGEQMKAYFKENKL